MLSSPSVMLFSANLAQVSTHLLVFFSRAEIYTREIPDVKIKKYFLVLIYCLTRRVIIFFGYYDIVLEGVVSISALMVS